MQACQELHLAQRDAGPWDLRATLDPETGATLFAALDALAKPVPSSTDGPDPRSAARRRADALRDLTELGMGAAGMPSANGAAPTLVVTIPYATLAGQLGAAAATSEPHQQPLSASAARRVSCDGKVLPVVLGGDSMPLNVGRTRYSVPHHLRRAVLLRDAYRCQHRACPALARHVHHVVHWAHHGETALYNLVALCGYHHREAHKPGPTFTIAATRGERPTFNYQPHARTSYEQMAC
jgi:Domain of unknown function (DUF222)